MSRPDKLAAQKEIDEKLAAFLETGGKIQNVPLGATGSGKIPISYPVNYFQARTTEEVKRAKR